jgi:glycosyltransferase involved in cell wall biosynthesis
MVTILGIPVSKIEIIPNGIDPDLTSAESSRHAQKLVGTVGRLTKQKGIEFLIRAMPMIISRHPSVKLLVAGSGEEESRLKALVEEFKMEGRVEFLGYLDDPISMMKDLDVFVLPSVWEGFPYVLLEAMALQIPIVATDIFGVNEIVKHQRSGILVRPKDPDSIADAVIRLISNKPMSRRMRKAAYNQLLDEFTLDKSILKTAKLYTQSWVA